MKYELPAPIVAKPVVTDPFLKLDPKYKPVHLKVRLIKAELPKQYQIIWDIKGDPLADLPRIDYAHIPNFQPTGRYTEDR